MTVPAQHRRRSFAPGSRLYRRDCSGRCANQRALHRVLLCGRWLGYAYAAAGEHDKAEAMIAVLNQMSSRRFVSPFCTALVYLGLGDKERALDGLDKAYEAR